MNSEWSQVATVKNFTFVFCFSPQKKLVCVSENCRMIERISVNNNSNSKINNRNRAERQDNSPNFQGRITDKAVDYAIKGIRACEKNPMINVAAIDLITAIGPRSIWESLTNLFAGFEAFRRESSGLIVNCMIPGFVALGAAKAVNKMVMGGNANLSSCWAGNDAIDTISDYYKNAESTQAYQDGMAKFNDAKKARVYATHYNMLNEASGIDGDARKVFGEISGANISETAEKLTNATFEEEKHLSFSERLKSMGRTVKGWFTKNKTVKAKSTIESAFEQTASQTHITENVKFGNGDKAVTSDLKSAMKNTTGVLKGFIADGVENPEQIEAFAKKAKKLVRVKSSIAMMIIIPLAASMQSINRWITTKMSGVKGAPIYDDYAKKDDTQKVEKSPEEIKADKKALIKQKFISVGSMVGVALLSMMKLPNKEMFKSIFEFKGQFPTMDQARAISTVTFGSRMAVADDKNELAEATTRDIVTFSSMYFLGDYAAKGYASYLENTKGVKLLNRTKQVDKDSNIFKKFGNWVVNTHLKSTDELVEDGVRSLEDMKHLRNKCQMVNLGSSLLILGLIVPVFTRLKTERNHKKELLAGMTSDNKTDKTAGNSKENVTIYQQHGNFKGLETFKNMRKDADKFSTFQSFKNCVESQN